MSLGIDLPPDDLKVFLQEADEQLELLDEDFIRLEKEADNPELMQEIFRAAHTLKGSSGMIGYHKMADLTHNMEDLLDRLRKGTVPVTADLVDALLRSLDALKILKDDLARDEETPLDIAPLVEALRAVFHPPVVAEAAATPASDALESSLAADAALLDSVDEARAVGLTVYVVSATIEPESQWAAVRGFQVLNELHGLGDVLFSNPSREQIEREEVEHSLDLVVATGQSDDAVAAAITSIADIATADVRPWQIEAIQPAGGPATTAPSEERVIDVGPDGRGKDPAELLHLAADRIALDTGKDPADRGDSSTPRDGADKRVMDLGSEARGKPPQEQLVAAARKTADTTQTIRIDVERLDTLMNMVGELAIDGTRVSQLSRHLEGEYKDDERVQALAETTTHISKLVNELHDSMMQTRMLPIGLLFSKYPRMVRDLARSLDKEIDFVVEGEDTEIDRSVIEKIKDPLVHMIRNSVDHGIELPAHREAAGKSNPALVRLSAFHDQGHIVIRLEDDGNGIDARAIRVAAVRKGVITQETADRLSDAEVIDLIFEPGFSMAEKTTEVSGRGVGLDVVRKGIAALNGTLKIDTTVGKGTIFTLELPLTLATFRGLLVSSNRTVYAIPLNYIQEIARLETAAVRSIMNREVLHYRGAVMPLLRLTAVCRTIADDGVSVASDYVVIIKAGDRQVGLAVETLIEQQEIVVKPLDKYLGAARGVTGASILGDGSVALILDVGSIVKAATQRD